MKITKAVDIVALVTFAPGVKKEAAVPEPFKNDISANEIDEYPILQGISAAPELKGKPPI